MLTVPKTGSQRMRIGLFKLRQLSPKFLLFPRPLARETVNQSVWVYVSSPAVPAGGQMFIHHRSAIEAGLRSLGYGELKVIDTEGNPVE